MIGIVENAQAFKWRRQRLLIGEDRLLLEDRGPFSQTAHIRADVALGEVTKVDVSATGSRRTLTVRRSDGADLRVTGVPAGQAEWAAEAVETRLRLAARTELDWATRTLPAAEVQAAVDGVLGTGAYEIIDLLDLLVIQAALRRASDIHIEPFRESARVRYRVDGVLVDVASLPREAAERLSIRAKVTANLSMCSRNTPQEGRMMARAGEESIDLRVSVLPTLHGEKITFRLFNASWGILSVDDLGMPDAVRDRYRRLLQLPQGTILMTGPSNSGKTTTMYASLMEIHNTRNVCSIATVEDPVEYDLKVINQTQTDPVNDLTFAAGLRTLLRQDPEVIMIGEIRDPETAEIAVRAGLTGHLIFSTVHARSAAAVFVRLTEMGVEPFLLASSVTAVLAQRLVRRVCPNCTAESAVPDLLRERLQQSGHEAPKTEQHGSGCADCGGTGYRGRALLAELLTVDDAFREGVVARSSAPVLEKQVAASGVPSLLQCGLDRVAAGETTVEEVFRVLSVQ